MLILLFSSKTFADDSAIINIRKEYQAIQKTLPLLKKNEFDLSEYATEGGHGLAYRDREGNIRLIKASLFLESGKYFNEFYFKDGKLIFAFYLSHHYNQHPGVTPEFAKKDGMEAFDPNKTEITEDRFYFDNSKLIRWLDKNKHDVNPNTKEFKDYEEWVMQTSNDMLSESKKNLTLHSRGTR
ncbi:MAG: hypothetical protein B7Y56_15960 [Gallionellales bacterium 35-53-114]|nr:MAG: hypothetical protein B7Y56_15960 [Gallionellales bacterium 35-53-114]